MTAVPTGTVTGPRVTLRPVTQADAGVLRDLFAETWCGELALAGLPAGQLDQLVSLQYAGRERSRAACDPPVDDRVVAGEDGTVLGRLVVQRTPEHLLLVDVELFPAYRGRGIGGALVRRLTEEAAAAGLPVRLSVHATNLAAQRLYARLGFRTTGTSGTHHSMEWDPR